MIDLVQSGIIEEAKSAQNIAYVLNDNSLFFLAGFKVIQNQEKNGYVKCAKMTYNGKIKLIYFTSSLKSLSSLLPLTSAGNFINIMNNLFHTIIEIKKNGFLDWRNIDISLDKIFVDSNTLSVYLIYVPINRFGAGPGEEFLENELRAALIKAINSTPSLQAPVVERIKSELSNGKSSMETLYKYICAEAESDKHEEVLSDRQPLMILKAINAPIKLKFHITIPVFIIGKNKNAVHGAIIFNEAISRMHCKIIFNKGIYFVVDLNSANGTYINGKKITSNQPEQIVDGDIIKLANIDFKVQI